MSEASPSSAKRYSRRELIRAGTTVAVAASLPTLSKGSAMTQAVQKHPNVAVVQRFYDALTKGDMDGVRQVLDPNIVWFIPGHNPLAGEKRGPDEVIGWLGVLPRAGYQAELLYLEGNDDYVVEVHRGQGSAQGLTLSVQASAIYTIREGRIVNARNHADDQFALDAYYWAIYSLKPLPDRLA